MCIYYIPTYILLCLCIYTFEHTKVSESHLIDHNTKVYSLYYILVEMIFFFKNWIIENNQIKMKITHRINIWSFSYFHIFIYIFFIEFFFLLHCWFVKVYLFNIWEKEFNFFFFANGVIFFTEILIFIARFFRCS